MNSLEDNPAKGRNWSYDPDQGITIFGATGEYAGDKGWVICSLRYPRVEQRDALIEQVQISGKAQIVVDPIEAVQLYLGKVLTLSHLQKSMEGERTIMCRGVMLGDELAIRVRIESEGRMLRRQWYSHAVLG